MFHAVIMAGGKGTRFWPLSRAKKAKQFLEIVGNKTLLKHTIDRIKPLVNDNIWIVGNQGQADYLADAQQALSKGHVLLEPFGRNTAPSIALAAIALLQKDPDAVMVVLPADHMITSSAQFRKTIKKACQHVQKNDHFVTIGIPPTFPHTGYGYIEAADKETSLSPVIRFCEKPDTATAQCFIDQGNFYWNAGIFVWRARSILEAIYRLVPDSQSSIDHLLTYKKLTNKTIRTAYENMPNISIDYAVMEKSAIQTRVIRAEFSWDDIGNWCAMEQYWEKDTAHNAHKGTLIGRNSHNNIVHSSKTVTLIDVDDMIVVETPDAILIAPKKSDQKIRELYDTLPKALR
jgi:mannose-1-phosphate guanylyltransferase